MTQGVRNLFIKLRRNKAASLGELILIFKYHISFWSSFSLTDLELILNMFSLYRVYCFLFKIHPQVLSLSFQAAYRASHHDRGCSPSSPAGGPSCCSTHPWGAHGCGVSHLLPGVQPAQQMPPDAGVPPCFLHWVPPEDPALPLWAHRPM